MFDGLIVKAVAYQNITYSCQERREEKLRSSPLQLRRGRQLRGNVPSSSLMFWSSAGKGIFLCSMNSLAWFCEEGAEKKQKRCCQLFFCSQWFCSHRGHGHGHYDAAVTFVVIHKPRTSAKPRSPGSEPKHAVSYHVGRGGQVQSSRPDPRRVFYPTGTQQGFCPTWQKPFLPGRTQNLAGIQRLWRGLESLL